jgi:hypothetical protein
MVERYVEGRMSDMELARFQSMLESDPQLRRMVETERSIRSTLLRDRNRLPHDDPRGRTQLLAMLAAASADPVVSGAAQGGAAAQGTSWLSGGLAKGIAIAVAGTTLAVGTYFGLQALDDQKQPATPPAVQIQQHRQSSPSAPVVQAQPQQTTVSASPPVIEQSIAKPAVPAAPVSEPQLQQRRPVKALAPATATVPVTTSRSDTMTAPAVIDQPVQVTPKRAPVVVIPDTMKVEVKIEME